MPETRTLKALADAVLKRDATRDTTRDGCLTGDETGAESWAPSATAAWRLTVDSCVPQQGPVALNGCTIITDPARCIDAALAALEIAVAAKNAGRDRSMLVALIDEQLATLAACGCIARVEALQ